MIKRPTEDQIKEYAKTEAGAKAGAVHKWEWLCGVPMEELIRADFCCPSCTLCNWTPSKSCCGCPLYLKHGFCSKSFYGVAMAANCALQKNPTLANFRKWRKAARAMLEVLKSL